MVLNILGLEIRLRKEIIAVILAFLAVICGVTGYAIVRSDRGIVVKSGDGPEGAGTPGGRNGQAQAARSGGAGAAAAAAAEAQGSGNPGGGTAAADKSAAASGAAPAGQADAAAPQAGAGGPAPVEAAVASTGEIKVYVVGCVNNPGIVTIRKGGLIADAIAAAGGAAEDADIENINLVYKLSENVMLRVKAKHEASAAGSGGGGGNAAGSGAVIESGDTGAVTGGGGSEGEGQKIKKININTATAEELDTLPGIGAATAGDIISYREKNGPYKIPEDIMNVPRIKESRFNSIKDYITVN